MAIAGVATSTVALILAIVFIILIVIAAASRRRLFAIAAASDGMAKQISAQYDGTVEVGTKLDDGGNV